MLPREHIDVIGNPLLAQPVRNRQGVLKPALLVMPLLLRPRIHSYVDRKLPQVLN